MVAVERVPSGHVAGTYGITQMESAVEEEPLVKRTLSAVAIAFILLSGAPAIAWSADKAPAAVQAEFAEFFAKFKAALKANDAMAVAGMAKLPFQNDSAVSSVAQFHATIYKDSFTKKIAHASSAVRRSMTADQENNDNYHIFCDELIFTFTRTPVGFLLTDISVND